jgi:hypothetical protein
MSERTFTMDLAPTGSGSIVRLDGDDISALLKGVVVRSSVDAPTSVELQPSYGHRATVIARLPDAQIVILNPEAVHHAIVRLSRWTNHLPTCARVESAGDCDCGLQATLLEVDPR